MNEIPKWFYRVVAAGIVGTFLTVLTVGIRVESRFVALEAYDQVQDERFIVVVEHLQRAIDRVTTAVEIGVSGLAQAQADSEAIKHRLQRIEDDLDQMSNNQS